MQDAIAYIVLGLLTLLGVKIACEKPKDGFQRRYTLLIIIVAAVVVCLVLILGLASILFGGC